MSLPFIKNYLMEQSKLSNYMKNKVCSFIFLSTILLTSCSGDFRNTHDHDINVYNLDILETSNLNDCKEDSVRTRFVNDEEFIPYLTLSQYADLYQSHLADSMYSVVSKTNRYSERWVIYQKVGFNKVVYFTSEINYNRKTISLMGSIGNTFKENDNPRDTYSLNYGLYTDGYAFSLSDDTEVNYSFAEYDFNVLKSSNNNYYLPLGLFDITYSFNSGVYFYYNYAGIYSTTDPDNFFNKKFNNTTVDDEMSEYNKNLTMPYYLREYNAYLFLYLLDNFYGLKEYKNIDSAINFVTRNGLYRKLFDVNGSIRSQAMSDVLTLLDDNHTALVKASPAWSEDVFIRYGAEGTYARQQLGLTLKDNREKYLPASYSSSEHEVLYSDDSKTAMFLLDDFSFGAKNDVFNSDGSVKSDAKKYDTFFAVISCLEEIKNKGTVENVILDLSTNGGGTLGVMMKLLCLISKNNSSEISYYDSDSSVISFGASYIDINNDSLYDLNDCFGDDFNIYILTSDCSFSCGNAFPCYSQIAGDAKIIGQKSGGGECVVAVHYLPNGEYVYHSSNLHIGSYNVDKNIFKGFESGANPDIYIADTSKFVDINYLANCIYNA